MSNIIPFNFNYHHVRVIDLDGEPWFIGKDVAKLLAYANPSEAIQDHCKARIYAKELGIAFCYQENQALTAGLHSETVLIPERDVYRLVLRPRLPEAEAFEDWVVGEVLPSIRKTGGYGFQKIDWEDTAQVANLLEQSTRRVQEQRQLIESLKPKADALERLTECTGSLCLRDAAKNLQMQPKQLTSWLSRNRWIYRRPGKSGWIAYQDKIQRGYLEHKITTVERVDGSAKVVEQVRVPPKGLAELGQRLGSAVAA